MIFLWRGLLLHWENYQVKKLGPSLRSLGQKLYKLGGSIQGDLFVEDRRKDIIHVFNSCTITEMCSSIRKQVSEIAQIRMDSS
jgi:hypothetical protein